MAPISNAAEGQQFTDLALKPSLIVTRVIGLFPDASSPISSTKEAGSSIPTPTIPLGR